MLARPARHAVAIAIIGLCMSSLAAALPKEGDALPNARLEDADGHVFDNAKLKGKPVLVVYEDKDSAKQNEALKKQLADLAKGDKYKDAVALAAVADLSAYDFWPIKGFVKDSIRKESKKQGTTIFCDWTGAFRQAHHLRKGVSSIVLFGKAGTVLFAGDGALDADQRQKLIDALKLEVEGPGT